MPKPADMTKSTVYTTSKSKKVTLIEQEAVRRSQMPSPITYQKNDGIKWGKGSAFIAKGERVTYAE